MNEIYDFCDDILSNRLIRTVGFSFHHEQSSNELRNIEIGYGIHGEPGSIKIDRERNFKPIIGIIQEKLRLSDLNSDVVILFNNLGGASEFIFWQFVHEFMEEVSVRLVKVYAGKFLTSLSKEALSVTMLEVRDEKLLEYLEHPVELPVGHLFNCFLEVCKPDVREFQLPQSEIGHFTKGEVTRSEIELTRNIIKNVCGAAVEMREYLNEVDGELGDGDTGSTLARAADALTTELKACKLNFNNPQELLLQISTVLMSSMGGTSGAIFSIFFQCASKAFCDENRHSVGNWLEGISLGMAGIMRHGKSSIGDRTLLDSLHDGYEGMKKCYSTSTKDTMKLLEAFGDGCRNGAEKTKTMKPKSGRSSYSLSDKTEDYVFESVYMDPGAIAVCILAEAVVESFKFPSV